MSLLTTKCVKYLYEFNMNYDEYYFDNFTDLLSI